MKPFVLLSLLSLSLGLAACSPAVSRIDPALLDNPLFAEWYYGQLQENMMSMQIQNNPILKDDAKKSIVTAALNEATQKEKAVQLQKMAGKLGAMVPVDQTVQGHVLLLNNHLYFSPDFSATPGPSVHLYLSTILDPRGETFPDATALDLGVLRNPYGVDSYVLPAVNPQPNYRSLVLWDTELKSVYGFAQLQVQQ